MNKSLLLLITVAGLTGACQNQTSETKTDSLLTENQDTVISSGKACYAYIKNRDTVLLSYVKAGDTVTGELSYNLFEKDKNSGKINGIIKGDTLIADYTAMGEGMTYTRQVAFLKKGSQLKEGYADIQEVEGKTVFKNIQELKFGNSIDLEEVPCK